MFKTKMTEMFGIERPIMQGGMQHLGTPEMASAVSNAGGLGTINVTIYPTPDELRAAIRRTKELTDKPFCVNVTLLPTLNLGEAAYQQLDVIFDEKIPVIETAGASPQAFSEIIKKHKVVWNHKCSTLKHSRKAQDLGVDIVTIVGCEVAGHPGKEGIGSMVLANRVSRELDIPVLAAGGIVDGHSLVAALSLGAVGVTMGSRFVATKECIIHDNFKQWIVGATENDSVLCQKSINNMVRVANNDAAKKCLEMEAQGAALEEIMSVISGKISKDCYKNGNINGCLFSIGCAAGLISSIKSVAQVMDDIMSEAEKTLNLLNTMRA